MPDAAPDPAVPPLSTDALDRHTRFFMWMIKRAVDSWKADQPSIEALRPPQQDGPLPMMVLPFSSDQLHLTLPTLDEDWPPATLSRKVMMRLLRSGLVFPISDPDDAWASPAQARATFKALLPIGTYVGEPYHHWDEMASDGALSRLAFAGLGGLRTERYRPHASHPAGLAKAVWQHDMSFMAAYPVRPGFERYGAAIYFDADQRPIAMYWPEHDRWVTPQDDAWVHVGWVWRCTLLIGTTVADHLVGVHWTLGNVVTTAARTRLSRGHWLRLLLKPFTWRTLTINFNACDSLCPPLGFVHRAGALTSEALNQAFHDTATMVRFKTVPQQLAERGALDQGDHFPWATDALALYNVIHRFVDDYITTYAGDGDLLDDVELVSFWHGLAGAPASLQLPTRSRQGLIDLISQFIWTVTGMHEAVGAINEYVLDPSFMSTKIRPGRESADVQASLQCLLIMTLTGLDMLRLMEVGDAHQIFGEDPRGRGAFSRLHDELTALSESITAANIRRAADPQRPWVCDTFNPSNLETGVSI